MRPLKHWLLAIAIVPIMASCLYAGSFTDMVMQVEFPSGTQESPDVSIEAYGITPAAVDVLYDLTYPYNSPCDVEVQYMGGTKLDWTDATVIGEHKGIYPAENLTLVWDRATDTPVHGSGWYHLRLRAKLGLLVGEWKVISFHGVPIEIQALEYVRDQDAVKLKFRLDDSVSSYDILWADDVETDDLADLQGPAWKAVFQPVIEEETVNGEVWKVWTDEGDATLDNDGFPIRVSPSEVDLNRHYYIQGN